MRTVRGICFLVLAVKAWAQAPVPTRSLGPVVATSQVLTRVDDGRGLEVRQLADGRLLLNHTGVRLLLLYDSLFKSSRVVLDSAGPPDRRYPAGSPRMIPYLGDSTVIHDRATPALLILDGNGNVARVTAAPAGTTRIGAHARVDSRGRLVSPAASRERNATPTRSPPQPGARLLATSSAVVRFDMSQRKLDTAFVVLTDTVLVAPPPARGQAALPAPPANALFFWYVTESAIASDGSIAIVRGEDYHIEWVDPNGIVTQSPRVAHEWKRLTDADKKRIADSLTVVRDSVNKVRLASITAPGLQPVYDNAGRITSIAGTSNAGRGTASAAPLPPPPAEATKPISPDLIPEYLPATTGGLLADEDNRLWIPLAPALIPPNARVYDIVDREGKLIDRVRLDSGQNIVGFGPGGNVYLVMREGTASRLVRRRFR